MAHHHLNSAGASIVSDETAAAVTAHLDLEREVGPYEAANRVAPRLETLKRLIAGIVGMEADDVALTDSATRAWNTLVYGLSFARGDVILTSQLEFGSTLAALVDRAHQNGAVVRVLPTDGDGRVDPDAVSAMLSPSVALIALAHAPAHLPIVNPIERIAQEAAACNIPFFVDACQSIGLLRFPKIKNAQFAVCGTGRKWLRGPRGTGFLAISQEWRPLLSPPTVDLANTNAEDISVENLSDLCAIDTGTKFELWEKNVANFLGLANAVAEYSSMDPDEVFRTIQAACRQLKSLLTPASRAHILLPEAQETGVVALRIAPDLATAARRELSTDRVGASVMSVWDAPLDFKARRVTNVLRLSPHIYTSESDLLAAAATVNRLFR